MQRSQRFKLIVVALAAVAALGACSTATAPYLLTKTPTAIGVDVPKTLVQSGTTAKVLVARAMGSGMMSTGPLAGHDFEGEHLGAYHWIKQGLWQSQKRLARAAWTMVLLDKTIADRNLVPAAAGSNVSVAGATITWTQEMVDAYKALIPSSFADNANFESVAKLPVAGDASDLPAFTYETAPVADAPYDIVVTFGAIASGDDSTDQGEEVKTFSWSADKSKFKFEQAKNDGTNSDGSTKSVERNYVAYDATVGSMAAGRQDVEHGTTTFEVKADPASTTHGAFIWFDASLGHDAAGEMSLANDGAVTISAQGYADDSGGTVTETITVTLGTTVTVFYIKEGFDSAGALNYAGISLDGGLTYVAFVGTGSEIGSYTAKTDQVEAEHQSMGVTSTEVEHEIRQNAGSVASSGALMVEVQNSAVTKGVWVASTDGFVTIIGTGFAKEGGEVKIAFTTVPASGAAYSIAKLNASNAPDTANAITGLTF